MRTADPVGPANDEWIRRCAAGADKIVAMWGVGGTYKRPGAYVADTLLRGCELYAIDITVGGHPQHPLYLSYSLPLQKLRPAG
jgi:hypothetical protein